MPSAPAPFTAEMPTAIAGRGLPPSPAPIAAALLAVVVLILAAWAALLYLAWDRGEGAEAFLAVLCGPAGIEGAGSAFAPERLAASALMWALMSLAMMLPTTLASVAAAASAAAVAPPAERPGLGVLALLGGSLGVWLAMAVPAAFAQALLAAAVAALAAPPRALAILAGAAIGAAGLYQFSEWKQRCLTSCRIGAALPAGESGGPAAMARLGFRQGIACLGCCGAMMAVMTGIGAMNLVWMAIFALLMTIEKLASGRWVSHAIGMGLIMAGAGLAFGAVGVAPVIHWLLR